MRKTLRNALGAALGTVLVSATLAGVATPAFAEDCATAAPLGAEAAAGTLDSETPELWWTHTVDAGSRVISLATPGGSATLEVRDATCAQVLCTDSASTTGLATCTLDSGPVVVGVIGDTTAPAGPVVGQGTAFVLDALPHVATECNDGVDNDRDGAADWPDDAQCTSEYDGTEAPVQVAAYGHITIETDSLGKPKMTLTGVFDMRDKFVCRLETALVQVTCVQIEDTEFVYTCTHFILTAKAFSTSKPLGPGSAKGYVECDSGSLATDEVDSTRSIDKTVAEADSLNPQVYLGTGNVIRCRAMGVGGAVNATGNYTVDCYEPGVAWPSGSVPDPRG